MSRLLIALLLICVLTVACSGSDEAEPESAPTDTATSAQVEPQAAMQQQEEIAQPEPQEQTDAQSSQTTQQSAEQPAASAASESTVQPEAEQTQIEVEQEDIEGTPVIELTPDIIGEHKGVRSERNVLGNPDAPVEIRYYGDFT